MGAAVKAPAAGRSIREGRGIDRLIAEKLWDLRQLLRLLNEA